MLEILRKLASQGSLLRHPGYNDFGKSDPPPAPDYAGAAAAQGAANKEAAIASSRLNNPNVVNPYGTQTWTENGAEGRPTITQKYSPQQQALFDQSMQTKGLLGGLGIQGAESLGQVIGKNLDLSNLPSAPGDANATRQSVLDAAMARVDTDTAKQRDQANSDLIAAGIRPGTEAYETAMDRIGRQYNDARNQAIMSSGQEASRDFSMDTQRRKDALAEVLAGRQTPLNEINALMSGSQVSNPFATVGVAQNANMQAAPLFAATQAQYGAGLDAYNAQQAQRAGTMNGLFSLGSAWLGA